ncbi:response regulator [Candidatus Woesebacteria bacterium]|nr:response regulator [Candidatus Woesebacteria bacterium]MCD8526972.1 response regulator [Candidatus Woesebacteria bacterium]
MNDSSPSILIVEDEAAMAKALELKLTKEGYIVKVAANGREGMSALRENQFDAMLLDIMMPEVDGWEMMETMQREGISLPILITSNLSQTEDIQRAEALGAKKFLVKSNQTLADIVAEVQIVVTG